MLDENIFINVKCVKTIFQHLGILKGPQDENMMKETLVYPMWNVYKWNFHSWKPKSTSEKNMKQRNQGLFNSHLFAHFLQFKYNLCWICETCGDVFATLWNLKKHLGWEHNLCIFYILCTTCAEYVCGNAFATRWNLKKHLGREHDLGFFTLHV